MYWNIVNTAQKCREKDACLLKIEEESGQEEKDILVTENDFYTLGLYDKENLTTSEVDSLVDRYKFQKGKSYALNLLTLKPYSVLEIYNKLIAREYDSTIAEGICEYLKEMKYLNDEEYAEKYVSNRIKNKPISRRMLLFELKQKGIESDHVENALEVMGFTETDMAYILYKKKFKHIDLSDLNQKRKVIQFFVGKGFERDTIKALLENECNLDNK